MNANDRFFLSLLTEFKIEAQPHIRSLWADLEELEGATDERVRATALQQALRRIRVLGRAAQAANAHEVQSTCQKLEHILTVGLHTRDVIRPGSLDALYRVANTLVETLYLCDAEPVLVESSVD